MVRLPVCTVISACACYEQALTCPACISGRRTAIKGDMLFAWRPARKTRDMIRKYVLLLASLWAQIVLTQQVAAQEADLTPQQMAELRKTIAGTYTLKGQGGSLGLCNNHAATAEIQAASKSKSPILKGENFCPALIAGAAGHERGFQALMDFFTIPDPLNFFANKNAPITPKNIEYLEDTLAVAFLTRAQANVALAPNPEFLVAVMDKTAAIAGAAWAGLNPDKSLAAELPDIVIRANERARAREGKPPFTEDQKKQLQASLAKQVAALPPVADSQIKACFRDTPQVNSESVMQNKLACAFAGERLVQSLVAQRR